MADNPRDSVTNELIFETLKSVQSAVQELKQDTLEVNQRLGLLEQQYASIFNRVDRIDVRLDRIETRLGLVEA